MADLIGPIKVTNRNGTPTKRNLEQEKEETNMKRNKKQEWTIEPYEIYESIKDMRLEPFGVQAVERRSVTVKLRVGKQTYEMPQSMIELLKKQV